MYYRPNNGPSEDYFPREPFHLRLDRTQLEPQATLARREPLGWRIFFGCCAGAVVVGAGMAAIKLVEIVMCLR